MQELFALLDSYDEALAAHPHVHLSPLCHVAWDLSMAMYDAQLLLEGVHGTSTQEALDILDLVARNAYESLLCFRG